MAHKKCHTNVAMQTPRTLVPKSFRPSPAACDDSGWTAFAAAARSAAASPPLLATLCLDAIAAAFATAARSSSSPPRPTLDLMFAPPPLLDRLSVWEADYLARALDTGLPVPAAVCVPFDEYWRRRHAVDGSRSPGAAAASSRTVYLTEHVGRVVEDSEPGYEDHAELAELLAACSPHVTALRCDRLRVSGPPFVARGGDPIRVDLDFVLSRLENLRTVSLVYEHREHNEWSVASAIRPFYGLNADDMDALGRGLTACGQLTRLAVTKSRVDGVRFDRLSPYLEQCARLEELDLSCCELRCVGAQSVARYATTAGALKSVNLYENKIGPEGAGSLATAAVLRRKNRLAAIDLNLSMNNISDTGAKYLASALASGVKPFTKLGVQTCRITEIGGINIVESLAYDKGLRALEIDNNPLTLEVAIALHEMLKTNLNITYLSTQNCNFPDNMTQFLNSVAFYNLHNKRSKLHYPDAESLFDKLEEETNSLEEFSIELEGEEEEKENNDN